jgi:competence protein ComEA
LFLHIKASRRENTHAVFSPIERIDVMRFLLVLIFAVFFMGYTWAAQPVNVNSASAEEISENLKGIGLSKARMIVEYREAKGSFLHIDELVNVKGIGVKTIDNNRGMILLQDETVSAEK